MIKDTLFSMPRFVNFCRKDMVESWRTNLLRVLLLYGVMMVVILWISYLQYSSIATIESEYDHLWMFSTDFFLWALFGFGCLNASLTMEKMKTKTDRLAMLMIPVTSFEKYLFRWFFSTVAFLAVFLLAFWLADSTRAFVYSLAYPNIHPIQAMSVSKFIFFLPDLKIVIAFYFFCQSCFVLGSTISAKNAFLKTFAAGALIGIIYFSLIIWMSNLFYDESVSSFARDSSQETKIIFASIIFSLLALFNWVLGYFRFKESEIINRM